MWSDQNPWPSRNWICSRHSPVVRSKTPLLHCLSGLIDNPLQCLHAVRVGGMWSIEIDTAPRTHLRLIVLNPRTHPHTILLRSRDFKAFTARWDQGPTSRAIRLGVARLVGQVERGKPPVARCTQGPAYFPACCRMVWTSPPIMIVPCRSAPVFCSTM